MKTILIIGALGFVGGRTARALLAGGNAVRCLARDPARVQGLAALGCEVVRGDVSDPASLGAALASVEAVYISRSSTSWAYSASRAPISSATTRAITTC